MHSYISYSSLVPPPVILAGHEPLAGYFQANNMVPTAVSQNFWNKLPASSMLLAPHVVMSSFNGGMTTAVIHSPLQPLSAAVSLVSLDFAHSSLDDDGAALIAILR